MCLYHIHQSIHHRIRTAYQRFTGCIEGAQSTEQLLVADGGFPDSFRICLHTIPKLCYRVQLALYGGQLCCHLRVSHLCEHCRHLVQFLAVSIRRQSRKRKTGSAKLCLQLFIYHSKNGIENSIRSLIQGITVCSDLSHSHDQFSTAVGSRIDTPKKSGAAARPQLSPEEYAAKKKAEKDAVYQMIDDTATEIVSDPDKFRAYLDTQARMDRYSAANALLIYKQQPQATQLKDFRDWQEDGVKVNKGAKSLSILEPVEYTKNDGSTGIAYNVKKVFDVAQTSGKKPAAPTLDRDPRKLVAIMLDSAPIDVSTVEELPSPNMGAFYKNEDQTLYIKRDIGNSVALCQCVAQELGHAQLAMNCEAYSRRDMGFSAVCVGYMLCRKFGVDVKNFAIDRIPEELAGKSPKEIRAELSKTRSAMSEIGSRVSEEIYRRRADRSKDQER